MRSIPACMRGRRGLLVRAWVPIWRLRRASITWIWRRGLSLRHRVLIFAVPVLNWSVASCWHATVTVFLRVWRRFWARMVLMSCRCTPRFRCVARLRVMRSLHLVCLRRARCVMRSAALWSMRLFLLVARRAHQFAWRMLSLSSARSCPRRRLVCWCLRAGRVLRVLIWCVRCSTIWVRRICLSRWMCVRVIRRWLRVCRFRRRARIRVVSVLCWVCRVILWRHTRPCIRICRRFWLV